MHRIRLSFALIAFALIPFRAFSQVPACTIAAPEFRLNGLNIFSEQQEQWLGDAQAAQLEPDYTLLPENETAELTRIGKKLLAQLPPTSIQFTFRVYNDEEVNAFSIAGGHVYVSRKMISDAHSEDEIAGVLAHEIGHIFSHAMSVGETRELKALLKIAALSDRRDVEDKQQLLINAPWKPSGGETDDQAENAELAADRIGIYAMTRAGYAPASFAENLDRVTDTKGHTGVFLKILAGESTETADRIRAAHKIVNGLPAQCGSQKPGKSASFAEFQQKLRTEVPGWVIEPTAGLASYQLDPPMRPALDWIRFSPDGNYILAQDESKVNVIRRVPLKFLFSIDADGADRAQFSPDSQHVSFDYPDKRVESWDIASMKRESIHDLVDYRGCIESSLSPDGKAFVCLRAEGEGVGLSLLDIETEKPFYENKKFNEFPGWGNHAAIVFSPDGKTLLVLVGGRSFAFDLVQRKPIPLRGHLSNLFAARVAFAGSNKIVFACGDSQIDKQGGVLNPFCLDSFPDGEKLGKFVLGDQWMRSITQGDQVLIGPAKESAALLIDPATGKVLRAFHAPQVDVFGEALVSESAKGGVAYKEGSASSVETVDLPISPLRPIAAGDFSSDGHYLAYSNSSRGSIWDIEGRKQPLLVRPFTGLRFDSQNRMQLQFLPSFQKPGTNLTMDPANGTQTAGASFQDEQFLVGGVLVYFKHLDKGMNGTFWNLEMQVSDFTTGKVLWTRHYSRGRPQVSSTDGDSLVILYDRRTEDADSEISHHKDKLIKTSDVMKEWLANGLVVEIVNAHTGEVEHILETPTRPVFRNDNRWVDVYGNYMAVHGNLNNTVVYRISDGVRTGAFYGRVLGGDGAQALLAVNNRDQEMIVYDAATGAEVNRAIVDHRPRAAGFVPSTHSLKVLTASQRVYTIPLSAPAPVANASTK
jgi:WD40 repeat protein